MASALESWVWMPHDAHAWVATKVLQNEAGVANLETQFGEALVKRSDDIKELLPCSDSSLSQELDNLTALDEFGEGPIIHQLRQRYAKDKIYTNIGTILVSINPYKLLPLYTNSVVQQYQHHRDRSTCPPHVFSIAAEAYKGLLEDELDQSVIISGESGAGKTEATKLILQYLSDVAGSDTGVEQSILQTNPVLEAFGNAKTVRNNNSSRFGKFMEILFTSGGRICAARIINYLLEKSRVVAQGKSERSYHIFYQLTEGAPEEMRSALHISRPQTYVYLNKSECFSIDGVSDRGDFDRTRRAMERLGFGRTEMEHLWTVLSAVLNLGNVQILPDPSKPEATRIGNPEQLQLVANLLKLPANELDMALRHRSVTIRGETSMIPLKLYQVEDTRDAFAKHMYSNLFDWLVERINSSLEKGPLHKNTIGVLDIFGFEIFEHNAFEQFCINYANEKLQNHFNNHIFAMEQEEYRAEGVPVEHIEFIDNRECIELIEKRPVGLISMMDEEVTMPNGNDDSLITKMHATFQDKLKSKFYDKVKRSPEQFIIKHYAGDVQYSTIGFVAKNSDKLTDTLMTLTSKSELPLIKELFASDDDKEAKRSERARALAKLQNIASASADSPVSAAAAGTAKQVPPGIPSLIGLGKSARDDGKTGVVSGTLSAINRSGTGTLQLSAANAGADGAGVASPRAAGAKTKKQHTLAGQFSNQLQSLLATLNATAPQFIRCIKPNSNKTPNELDSHMVLRQLKYAGLFEAIRIRRSGYPFRKPIADFVHRYRICLQKTPALKQLTALPKDDRKAQCSLILDTLRDYFSPRDVFLGLTKVFMRPAVRSALDKVRDKALHIAARKLQALARGVAARKMYQVIKELAVKLAGAVKGRDERKLEAVLQQAEDSGIMFHAMVYGKELLRFFKEETRVVALVENAIKLNQLDALQAALEQSSKLDLNYNEPSSKQRQEVVNAASAARDRILKVAQARTKLRAALMSDDILALRTAIAACQALSLTDPEVAEAQSLLATLEREQQLMDDLKQAVQAGASGSAARMEAALDAVATIDLDESRRAVVSSAVGILDSIYGATASPLMAAEDEVQLKALLAKANARSLTHTSSAILSFLEELTRKRLEAQLRAERERMSEEQRMQAEAAERAAQEAAARAKAEAEAQAAARRQQQELERLRILEYDLQRESHRRLSAEQAATLQRDPSTIETLAADPFADDADDDSALPPPLTSPTGSGPKPPSRGLPKRPSFKGTPPPAGRALLDHAGLPPSASSASSMVPQLSPSAAAGDSAFPYGMPPPPPAPEDDDDMPPPPPADDADVMDPTQYEDNVRSAMRRRSLSTLNTLLESKIVARFPPLLQDSRALKQARKMVEKLEEEKKVIDRIAVCVSALDRDGMKNGLRDATDLLLPTDNPVLVRARYLCYGVADDDFTVMELKHVVTLKMSEPANRARLLALLDRATARKIRDPFVRKAKEFSDSMARMNTGVLASTNSPAASPRGNKAGDAAGGALSPMAQQYASGFMQLKGLYVLDNFPRLRREGNYAKRNYFKKKTLKAQRLQWQREDIPRSLFKLSTEFCGSKKDSQRVKKKATGIFRNVMGYMGDVFHSYPLTLAQEVLSVGLSETLLRDEIYLQVMKQTIANPNEDSTLLGYKLLYLCLLTFPPSADLSRFLLSHLAAVAMASLPSQPVLTLKLDNVRDVATASFFAYKALAKAVPARPPDIEDIRSLTEGLRVVTLELGVVGQEAEAAVAPGAVRGVRLGSNARLSAQFRRSLFKQGANPMLQHMEDVPEGKHSMFDEEAGFSDPDDEPDDAPGTPSSKLPRPMLKLDITEADLDAVPLPPPPPPAVVIPPPQSPPGSPSPKSPRTPASGDTPIGSPRGKPPSAIPPNVMGSNSPQSSPRSIAPPPPMPVKRVATPVSGPPGSGAGALVKSASRPNMPAPPPPAGAGDAPPPMLARLLQESGVTAPRMPGHGNGRGSVSVSISAASDMPLPPPGDAEDEFFPPPPPPAAGDEFFPPPPPPS